MSALLPIHRLFRAIIIVGAMAAFIIVSGCQFSSDAPQYSQRHSAYGNHSADISASNHIALLVTNDNKLSLWDTKKYAPLPVWTNPIDFPAKVTLVALSPSGKYAATATKKRLVTWNIHTDKPIGYWKAPSKITEIKLSNDGQYALVGTQSKQAYYVDVKHGKTIWSLQHSENISAIALAENGRYAVTGARDNSVILWNLTNGRPLQTWDHPDKITKVAISPDLHYVMTAAYNDKVRIWDAKNGKLQQIVDTLPVIVSAATFSPNSRYLAIGADPQILYIWDLKKAKLIKQWVLPKEKLWKPIAIRIHAVDFSDDNKHVMTEDSSGKYHVWSLD